MKLYRLFKKRPGFFKRKHKVVDNIPQKHVTVEQWEEDFLVKKVQEKFSTVPEDVIRDAVKSCYSIFRSPEPAENLVYYVISKLNDESCG